jgi:MATE family multidrug resistance protein
MNRNRQILRLAVPSIISNITVPLIGLVDLTISGHLGSVVYIGAIAVGTMIFNVIYWIIGFLRMGTSGMTSQAFGRRDMAEVMRLMIRSLTVGLSAALLFVIFQRQLCSLALIVMHPSADVAPLAARYFNIVIWGAPAMMCQFGLTGWFIGMQNTRAPMAISIAQNVVNIILSLFFVVVVGMNIDGVAAGTLLAQWFGLAMAAVIWRNKYSLRLRKYNWRDKLFTKQAMRSFFSVNRDIFFRTLFLVAVNLFFISAGARQGDIILSVNTLLMTMFTIFSYFMDGFAYAAEALSGRYYGADNRQAFSETCRELRRWGIAVVVMFTLLYAFGGETFLSLLTNQQDVVLAARPYFYWAVLIPVAGVAAFIYDGIFIGITATGGMLLSSAVSAMLFFILYFIFSSSMGNNALWMAFIIYLAMRGIMQSIILKHILKW